MDALQIRAHKSHVETCIVEVIVTGYAKRVAIDSCDAAHEDMAKIIAMLPEAAKDMVLEALADAVNDPQGNPVDRTASLPDAESVQQLLDIMSDIYTRQHAKQVPANKRGRRKE